MVDSGQSTPEATIQVDYAPAPGHELQPLEIVDRAELLRRIKGRELSSRQRASFHQLVVCTGGSGTHEVDYESIELSPGTLLRIHPGQVQQFVTESHFDAHLLLWPEASHHQDPAGSLWFPGSEAASRWQCDPSFEIKVNGWIDELLLEQAQFDGSQRRIELMGAMLCALLLRLAIEQAQPGRQAAPPPQAYLEFRELVEQELQQRPTVASLARSLGYSTRTLDRACEKAAGQTAKQVLDERVALELRRLLTHTNRPIARISADFGFSDQSNFSKFIKRHLGRTPGDVRQHGG